MTGNLIYYLFKRVSLIFSRLSVSAFVLSLITETKWNIALFAPQVSNTEIIFLEYQSNSRHTWSMMKIEILVRWPPYDPYWILRRKLSTRNIVYFHVSQKLITALCKAAILLRLIIIVMI